MNNLPKALFLEQHIAMFKKLRTNELNRRLSVVSFLFGFVFLVGACSSDNIASTDPTPVPSRIAIIEIDSSVDSSYKQINARFLTTPDTIDSAAIDTIIDHKLPTPGNCAVDSESPLLPFYATHSLDVGDSIILSSEAGTYSTINRKSSERTGTTYEGKKNIDGAFPETLKLDVSNVDFQVDNGLPLVLAEGTTNMIEPEGPRGVFADTVYKWKRSTSKSDQHYIVLWIGSGDLILNTVICTLPESGSFSVPEETLAILRARSEISFDSSIGQLRSIGTVRSSVIHSNGTMFITRHSLLSEGSPRL